MQQPKTLFQKIWDNHVVAQDPGSPSILYIDLHLVHEVTSPQAFTELRERGLQVRQPDRTVATMDHSTPTISMSLLDTDDLAASQLRQMRTNCARCEPTARNLVCHFMILATRSAALCT